MSALLRVSRSRQSRARAGTRGRHRGPQGPRQAAPGTRGGHRGSQGPRRAAPGSACREPTACPAGVLATGRGSARHAHTHVRVGDQPLWSKRPSTFEWPRALGAERAGLVGVSGVVPLQQACCGATGTPGHRHTHVHTCAHAHARGPAPPAPRDASGWSRPSHLISRVRDRLPAATSRSRATRRQRETSTLGTLSDVTPSSPGCWCGTPPAPLRLAALRFPKSLLVTLCVSFSCVLETASVDF